MSTLAPNDPNIIYSPYNWHVSAARAKTINAGAYFRVAFTGSPAALAATFDTSAAAGPAPRFSVRIDNGPWTDYDAAPNVPLTLRPGNTWTVHTLELVFVSHTDIETRWAAPQKTGISFTGLTADTAIASRAGRTRPLRGLAVGDSITEGMRTLQQVVWPDTLRNDSRLSHAYPLGELLGAEMGIVGFGGTGIAKAGSGGVPQFSDSIPYLWEGQPRTLTPAPDFVLAHIGTNDSTSTDAAVTAGTTAFLNWLLTAAPAAKVVVASGWMQTKRAAIIAGIAACSAPARVTLLDTAGWYNTADSSDTLHPYGYANTTDLAPRLAAAIRPLLVPPPAGNQFIRNAAGVAVPYV